jgi:DHA1 family bicyclomycin/chloramphenicol resistance-like MFS transporter
MPVRLLLVLGALAALGPAAMDIHLPGLPALAADFEASTPVAQATVGVYLLGLAIGQLLAGPLSDSVGRRQPMLGAMLVFVLASLVCATAASMALLLGGRFVQGTSAAAGTVIGRAVIRDLHGGAVGARYLSRLVLVYGLGPVVAPLIGGQLLLLGSWRWAFVALAIVGLLIWVTAVVVLPETHPPTRRSRLGATPTAVLPFRLLQLPLFRAYALAMGCVTGAIVAYVSASPFLLQDAYGVSPQLFGVLFAANAAGLIGASQLNARLLATRRPAELVMAGVATLVVAGAVLVGAIVVNAALWVVEACLFMLMSAYGFIPANAVAVAMEDHPDVAGSASALLGAAQYGVAAVVAPAVGLGGSNRGLAMALTVLGLGAVAAVAVWSERARQDSNLRPSVP